MPKKFGRNYKIKNYLKMIKRAPLYIVLATAWREFEKIQKPSRSRTLAA
jgi:hypothetical protein